MPTHPQLPEHRLNIIIVMKRESVRTCWGDRFGGKSLQSTGGGLIQADRTKAVLKTSHDPVHLLLRDPEFPTPAAVLTTFKCLLTVLTRFGDRPLHR
jgi:hypothetical protein